MDSTRKADDASDFLIVIPVANKVKAPCWNHVLFHVTFDKLPESRIMKCLVMTRENLAIFVNVHLSLALMFYLFSRFGQSWEVTSALPI